MNCSSQYIRPQVWETIQCWYYYVWQGQRKFSKLGCSLNYHALEITNRCCGVID